MCHFHAIFKSYMQSTIYSQVTCSKPLDGQVSMLISQRWQVGFENGMKMTPIFTIIFISKMLI